MLYMCSYKDYAKKKSIFFLVHTWVFLQWEMYLKIQVLKKTQILVYHLSLDPCLSQTYFLVSVKLNKLFEPQFHLLQGDQFVEMGAF
jgi:hypothetical protein